MRSPIILLFVLLLTALMSCEEGCGWCGGVGRHTRSCVVARSNGSRDRDRW
jgi:hypothetical protein